MMRYTPMAVLALGLAFASTVSASAQTATDAQKEALRSDCVGDFLSHCRGVPRGGVEAFECLVKNYDSLDASCQAAVKAVDPKVE
ncbi:MAG: hypothetical protein NXI27_17710 [Alphaproteobacteria bacterium]|nr:hypothetical protein [Alphaproteobacteria bacterium]